MSERPGGAGMRRATIIAGVARLAACGSHARTETDAAQPAASAQAPARSPTATLAAAPDLAACPAREPVDEGLRQRTSPIPAAPALREAMRSDMDNFAFSTLGGETVCADASWIEGIRDAALSSDGRFAAFGWDGYESYGHVIVDRSGKGQAIDTGVQPVASPSGKLLAAADLSESGFGSLNAFAVWRIEREGIRQLAMRESAAGVTDWRIDGWTGEGCVNLSAVAWDNSGDANPPREPFRAREGNGWRIEPGRCAPA